MDFTSFFFKLLKTLFFHMTGEQNMPKELLLVFPAIELHLGERTPFSFFFF